MPKTVLIVEDEPSLQHALADALNRGETQVVTASNGQEGLTLALAKKPDIVVLDLLMPVMGGEEMLAQLRTDDWGKSVPVIILSNVAEKDDIARNLNLVADGNPLNDYLIKSNVSVDHLTQLIAQKLA